jgi:hypothetical protein
MFFTKKWGDKRERRTTKENERKKEVLSKKKDRRTQGREGQPWVEISIQLEGEESYIQIKRGDKGKRRTSKNVGSQLKSKEDGERNNHKCI